MQVHGYCCCQYDEKSDQVGEPHADVSIDLDTMQVGLRLFGCFLQRFFAIRRALLLNFLRRLPEKR